MKFLNKFYRKKILSIPESYRGDVVVIDRHSSRKKLVGTVKDFIEGADRPFVVLFEDGIERYYREIDIQKVPV